MFLCLDYGDRYIGVAATDLAGKVPYRYSTIDQKKQDAIQSIKRIVEKESVGKILVGVPLNMANQETEQTRKTLAFIKRLTKALGMKVERVNEILSSREAKRIIQDEGAHTTDEHAEAARIMLESYIKAHQLD